MGDGDVEQVEQGEGETSESPGVAATAVAAEPAVERPAPRGSAALGAPGPIRACPLPTGALLFGDLTSAFVDGPRLLRFLGDRRHTGAVVDVAGSRTQVVLLYDGAVVGLVGVLDSVTRRLDRVDLPGPGAGVEEHELRVLTYRPEITLALAQLVNLPERFAQMHGSFVDVPALLAYLGRERANGAVRITTADDVGVVLLRGGEVLGAYTRQRPDLEDADVVFPLAKTPEAEIDVHTGPLTIPPPSLPVGQVV